jgi:hypothetical protein
MCCAVLSGGLGYATTYRMCRPELPPALSSCVQGAWVQPCGGNQCVCGEQPVLNPEVEPDQWVGCHSVKEMPSSRW